MTQNVQQHVEQRTLIIGAGEVANSVIQAFRRRLAERRGEQLAVTCLAVIGQQEQITQQGEWKVITLPVGPTVTTRHQAQQALIAARPAITSALAELLAQISRLRLPASNLHSRLPNRHEEVAIHVIATLYDPLGSAIFLDLAAWARHIVSQRLNVPAQVTGWLFFPDLLVEDDPSPVMAQTYATLLELDGRMRDRARSSSHIAQGVSGAVGSMVSHQMLNIGQSSEQVFDGGCYLFGALNGHGLALWKPEYRIELAAEALLQSTGGLLSMSADQAMTVLCSTGGRPQGYGGVGLAAWVYPGHALAEILSCSLASELLSACLEPDSSLHTRAEDMSLEAESFLLRFAADAAENLPPAGWLEEAEVWRALTGRLSPRRVHKFRQDMEDEAAKKLEPLAVRRPALDAKAVATGKGLAEKLEQFVARTLDRSETGRLAEAATFLAEIEQQVSVLQIEVERAADGCWKELEELDAQIERTGAKMEEMAARFPVIDAHDRLDWRSLLHVMRSPRRLIRLFQIYRELGQLGANYSSLLARQMALAIEVLQRDLLNEAYDEAQKEIEAQRALVTQLVEAVSTAKRSLGSGSVGEVPPHRNPVALEQMVGDSFGLEQCVLTPESIEDLYSSIRGDLTERLAGFQERHPLSAWLRSRASADIIAAACSEYAHGQCQALEQIAVDELVVRSLPSPQDRMEALRVLVALSSPFLAWDETRLRDTGHQFLRIQTTLGTGTGMPCTLLEGINNPASVGSARTHPGSRGDSRPLQVVATGENQRVTAITTVRGLPLAAVGGLEEYAAAYCDADRESLHVDGSWRDWPDLVEGVVDE
jgi:hypothetical protein